MGKGPKIVKVRGVSFLNKRESNGMVINGAR